MELTRRSDFSVSAARKQIDPRAQLFRQDQRLKTLDVLLNLSAPDTGKNKQFS